jgi:TetR/AcrR family transcriptional regulator
MPSASPVSSAPNVARRKRADGLKTIERILEVAEAEMSEFGLADFNLDRVIEKSGVARSSVYHHFGGRNGLIAALETSSTMRSLERGMSQFDAMLDDITSGEQAFQFIEMGLRLFGSQENRQLRQRRITSLAACQSAPAIREVLAKDQRWGTDVFARVLEKSKERGLCDPVEPFLGLAYLIQSMLVGRILVDISDDSELDRQWEDAALASLRLMLRPSP